MATAPQRSIGYPRFVQPWNPSSITEMFRSPRSLDQAGTKLLLQREEREKNTGATWKITITITGGSYVNSALLARTLPLRVLGTGLAVTGELTTWASAGSGRQR